MNNIRKTTETSAQKLMDARISVIKIGGGILRSRSDLVRSAKMVSAEFHRFGPPIVVISALYGMTDNLIAMNDGRRHEIVGYLGKVFGDYDLSALKRAIAYLSSAGSETIDSLSTDEIISLGEKLTSIAFLGILKDMGEKAEIVDPSSIITVMNSRNDREVKCNTGPLIDVIARGNICVVPGFYCSDSSGKTVTLGRGGSDFSAGIIAGSIGADSLEFWKDVPGIMSADPCIVQDAITLEEISADMAAEISRLGGKVLHQNTLSRVNSERTLTTVRNKDNGKFTTILKGRGDGFAVVSTKKRFTLASLPGEKMNLTDVMEKNDSITVDLGDSVLLITDPWHDEKIKMDFCNHCNGIIRSSVMALVSVVHDFPASSSVLLSELGNDLLKAGIQPEHSLTLSPELSVSFAVPLEKSSEAVRRIHSFISSRAGVLHVKN